MSSWNSQRPTSIVWIVCITLVLGLSPALRAEEEETGDEEVQETTTRSTTIKKTEKTEKKKERRKFITDHPDRIDAGIFYVAAAIGGNFYTEPRFTAAGAPSGDYFNDFGFQGGVYFDYDYSQLTENVPLALRGFVGYKYILNSVHCFSFDGMVRRMMQVYLSSMPKILCSFISPLSKRQTFLLSVENSLPKSADQC